MRLLRYLIVPSLNSILKFILPLFVMREFFISCVPLIKVRYLISIWLICLMRLWSLMIVYISWDCLMWDSLRIFLMKFAFNVMIGYLIGIICLTNYRNLLFLRLILRCKIWYPQGFGSLIYPLGLCNIFIRYDSWITLHNILVFDYVVPLFK